MIMITQVVIWATRARNRFEPVWIRFGWEFSKKKTGCEIPKPAQTGSNHKFYKCFRPSLGKIIKLDDRLPIIAVLIGR